MNEIFKYFKCLSIEHTKSTHTNTIWIRKFSISLEHVCSLVRIKELLSDEWWWCARAWLWLSKYKRDFKWHNCTQNCMNFRRKSFCVRICVGGCVCVCVCTGPEPGNGIRKCHRIQSGVKIVSVVEFVRKIKNWNEQNYQPHEIGMQFRSTEAFLVLKKQRKNTNPYDIFSDTTTKEQKKTYMYVEKNTIDCSTQYTRLLQREHFFFCEKYKTKRRKKLNQNWNRFTVRLHCSNAAKLLLL